MTATWSGGRPQLDRVTERGQRMAFLTDWRPSRCAAMRLSAVRGHVPNPVNKLAGGALGNFATYQRVLDTEKYPHA